MKINELRQKCLNLSWRNQETYILSARSISKHENWWPSSSDSEGEIASSLYWKSKTRAAPFSVTK